jgi:hypothetical protein
MKYLFFLLVISNVLASASKEVFIRGKITGVFDEKKVKVVDHLGQTYFLPRHVFPKEVLIKQGQEFSVEVHETDIEQVKILKK